MARELRILVCLAAVALGVAACAENPGGGTRANTPPDVWLSSGPPEGSVTDYRVHFYWGGWDPDGEIAYYEYAIADNPTGVFNPADTVSTSGDYAWTRIDGNDAELAFSADAVDPPAARGIRRFV